MRRAVSGSSKGLVGRMSALPSRADIPAESDERWNLENWFCPTSANVRFGSKADISERARKRDLNAFKWWHAQRSSATNGE